MGSIAAVPVNENADKSTNEKKRCAPASARLVGSEQQEVSRAVETNRKPILNS
jgi:hypothetical protein